MTETPAPRKRGRPATGKARTAAQRMADSRQRALEALNASLEPDLSGVSDTGLFEALRVSYRQAKPWDMGEVARELFKRANTRTRRPVALRITGADNATVAENNPAASTPGAPVDTRLEAITAVVAQWRETIDQAAASAAQKGQQPPAKSTRWANAVLLLEALEAALGPAAGGTEP